MGGGEKEYKLPTQVRLQFPTTVHNWAETQCPKTGLVRQFYLVNLPFFSTAQQQGKPTLCQTAIISHVAVTSSALLSCLYSIFYTKGSILEQKGDMRHKLMKSEWVKWSLVKFFRKYGIIFGIYSTKGYYPFIHKEVLKIEGERIDPWNSLSCKWKKPNSN